MPGKKSIIGVLLLAVLSIGLTTRPALAVINSVTAAPGQANVAVTQTTSLAVTWTVNATTTLPSETIVSQRGEFRIGGNVVGTVNRVLTRTFPPLSVTAVFTETITVPRSLAVQAARSGQPLLYVRSFTDSGTAAPGISDSIRLAVTGASSAAFAISRISLSFLEDDSRAKVTSMGSSPRAVARILFTGSELLEAEWQVARPTTTSGQLIFRPLRLVRQYLTAGGEVRLVSPPLPTNIQGQYLVRLEVQNPELGFEPPRLIYFVVPETPLAAAPPQDILLRSPAPSSVLDPSSQIAWVPVEGADVYQVILYRPDDEVLPAPSDSARYGEEVSETAPREGEAVTGFYLPADVTAAVLPAVAQERLEAGKRYYLRVVAIDPNGAVIGRSPLQEVFWP